MKSLQMPHKVFLQMKRKTKIKGKWSSKTQENQREKKERKKENDSWQIDEENREMGEERGGI